MDWTNTDFALFFTALLLLYTLYSRFRNKDRLRGPPSPGFFYGFQGEIMQADPQTVALRYEKWMAEYGSVFSLPMALGSHKILFGDTKALQHVCSRDTFGYGPTVMGRAILEHTVGGGILVAEGESHKRQRKALSSGFSNASIRTLSAVFFEAGHRTSAAWRRIIDASQGTVSIDVQEWMNRITLDSIGLAGFSHDFESISGKQNAVADAFENLSSRTGGAFFTSFLFLFGRFIPGIFHLSTRQVGDMQGFRNAVASIARGLLEKNRKEKEEKDELGDRKDKSIVSLLIKAEQDESGMIMTPKEVSAQMNTVLIAGFATTSVSLTWALIELSRHPKKQECLQRELLKTGAEPPYDELVSPTHYPYLDAVVHETLRLHPAVGEVNRQCNEDDLVPLAHPITLASGETVNSVPVKKGTNVTLPIFAINTSEELWGSKAKEFVPERWLSDTSANGGTSHTEIHGYRHLLTFMHGPRTCLGRTFAVAEFKVILAILVRNFTFELPGGVNTKISTVRSVTTRPKIEGEEGVRVPMLVRSISVE